ncbi:MAG: hypothetical protein L0H84_22905, partial [Pseudonocardia sp.]|nr:hypothetical protein [Pseudonocardia sp.]
MLVEILESRPRDHPVLDRCGCALDDEGRQVLADERPVGRPRPHQDTARAGLHEPAPHRRNLDDADGGRLDGDQARMDRQRRVRGSSGLLDALKRLLTIGHTAELARPTIGDPDNDLAAGRVRESDHRLLQRHRSWQALLELQALGLILTGVAQEAGQAGPG